MHLEVLNRGDTPWELSRFRYEVSLYTTKLTK